MRAFFCDSGVKDGTFKITQGRHGFSFCSLFALGIRGGTGMNKYVVQLRNRGETVISRPGNSGIFAKIANESALFPSCHAAVQHISEILPPDPSEWSEPLEIHIVPAPECAAVDDEWSIEDILRNAG